MAFSDYKTISQVQQEFSVVYQEDLFLVDQPVFPSDTFLEEISFSLEHIDVYTSEAARTETIIFPILREVYKSYHEHFSLWIQKPIAFNDKLSGVPDYVVSIRSALGKTVLERPLVLIAEAKKNDFEQGWGQCLAELVAAQRINGTPERPIYGIVTDGKLWECGFLQDSLFTKNSVSFTVDDLPRLFGVLHMVFDLVMSKHIVR